MIAQATTPAIQSPVESRPMSPALRIWWDDPDILPDDSKGLRFEPSPVSPTSPVSANPPETLRDLPTQDRTTGPVLVPSTWTLRSVRDRLYGDWPDSKGAASWLQYKILINRWEEHFEGQGPHVGTLTPEILQQFFLSTTSWASPRSWQKNLDMLMALLKSVCRQSHTNKMGLPRGMDAPLLIDDLPFVSMPSDAWFREHRVFGAARQGGHSPKRRSNLTLQQYQRVIDICWTKSVCRDPVWWETLFAWLWFSGMRITQARRDLAWAETPDHDGIHLESMSLITHEAKRGGLIDIPLPLCLEPNLKTLFIRHKQPDQRPYVFRQCGQLSQDGFYESWNAIWMAAIPCAEAERATLHFSPHHVRSVSVTNWDLQPNPDNLAGHLITGHKPGDVRTACYFKPGDQRLREIVERFPMPKLHCPRTLF